MVMSDIRKVLAETETTDTGLLLLSIDELSVLKNKIKSVDTELRIVIKTPLLTKAQMQYAKELRRALDNLRIKVNKALLKLD